MIRHIKCTTAVRSSSPPMVGCAAETGAQSVWAAKPPNAGWSRPGANLDRGPKLRARPQTCAAGGEGAVEDDHRRCGWVTPDVGSGGVDAQAAARSAYSPAARIASSPMSAPEWTRAAP
jgi:hypothetical protein